MQDDAVVIDLYWFVLSFERRYPFWLHRTLPMIGPLPAREVLHGFEVRLLLGLLTEHSATRLMSLFWVFALSGSVWRRISFFKRVFNLSQWIKCSFFLHNILSKGLLLDVFDRLDKVSVSFKVALPLVPKLVLPLIGSSFCHLFVGQDMSVGIYHVCLRSLVFLVKSCHQWRFMRHILFRV